MLKIWISLAVLALLGGAATASPIVYDNGPINGTVNANTINTGWEVSNSFTLGSAMSLTGAQVGLWSYFAGVPVEVSWSIGTTPFGSDIASGTGALTSAQIGTLGFGFCPVYESDFSLPHIVLGPGTYFLTLENTHPESGGIYWDQNFGPSIAYQRNVGAGIDMGQLGTSQSFQLFGDPVPEPATLAVLGLMAVGGGVLARRPKAVPLA